MIRKQCSISVLERERFWSQGSRSARSVADVIVVDEIDNGEGSQIRGASEEPIIMTDSNTDNAAKEFMIIGRGDHAASRTFLFVDVLDEH